MNDAAPYYLLTRLPNALQELQRQSCVADFSFNQLLDLPPQLGGTFAQFMIRLTRSCPGIAAQFELKLANAVQGKTQAFLVEFPHLSSIGLRWYQLIGQAYGASDQRKVKLELIDVSSQRFCEVNDRIANHSIDLERFGLVVADAASPDLAITFVNPAFEKISGYTAAEVVGKNCRFMQGFDEDQPGLATLKAGMDAQMSCTSLLNNFRKDGTLFVNEVSIFPVLTPSNEVLYFVGIQRDLSVEQQAKSALELAYEREKIGLKFAQVGVFEVNPLDRSVQSQGYASDLLGLPNDTDLTLDILVNAVVPEDKERFEMSLISCLEGASGIDLEYGVRLPNGSIHWLHTKGHLFEKPEGIGLRLVCMSQDVTQRHIIDRHNRYIAQHDPLTGLPNRAVMRERCEQVLSVAKRDKSCVALMFIDLDDFKIVNDSHGHQVGDELLKQVAQRLRASVRAADTVCRQSGDEFIVILQGLADVAAIENCIHKVHEALQQPYQIDHLKLKGSASVGVSCSPSDGQTSDELVRHADMAMYAAKRKGGGQFAFFSSAIGQQISDAQQLRSELFAAIKNRELVLFYQPQIHTASSKLVGLEALLRWRHPTRGLLKPAQFLSIAYGANDLLFAIEEWVFREAIGQRSQWTKSRQFNDVPVFINVSPCFFSDEHFQIKLASYLHEAGCNAREIGLEIAETALWRGDPEADLGLESRFDRLRALDAMGLRLTIDNYGSGGSTITQLAKCPVESIKLDQSWIANLNSDRAALNALSAVAHLSRSLHLQVITQGIESRQQAQTATQLGFDTLQGNLLCIPVNPVEIAHFSNHFIEKERNGFV